MDKPKAKRSRQPDVKSFLADKAETERDLKNQELQFRREALDTEMKLKRDARDVEMRRIELQEKASKHADGIVQDSYKQGLNRGTILLLASVRIEVKQLVRFKAFSYHFIIIWSKGLQHH